MNFSETVARTDAQGHFEFASPYPEGFFFLFAAGPCYGRLLQTTFGQAVAVPPRSNRIRNVLIPALPATELSGYVYDTDGQPLVGCSVSAVSHRTPDSSKFADLSMTRSHAFSFGLPEAEDPNQFLDAASAETGKNGEYKFARLGADRYLLLTRCQTAENRQVGRSWWEPVFYRQANSIESAQEIVLQPGEHRSGFDFHLAHKMVFTLQGKILFSDGAAPRPWPEAIYHQEIRPFCSNRTLTSTSLGEEACWIDANTGTFRCDALLPGTYTFYDHFRRLWRGASLAN